MATPDDRRATPGGVPRQSGDPAAPAPSQGADLAREALAAARERNAAKRSAASSVPVRRRPVRTRRRWSAPGPDARDPQPLGAALRSWVKANGAAADLTRATVFARWAQIVGPEIADHCAPVSLVDGELLVQAESTAWATQLRLMSAQVLRKVNAEVGPNAVRRLRAKGPTGPTWRFGERHVPGRGPRDTYG